MSKNASMLRVRVDFPSSDGPPGRADLVVPADVPVAAVLPELVDAFGPDPAPGASWRVRLPDGTTADPERGLRESGVRDGDRLIVADDPGPTPPPLVVDVADLLAEGAPGVGVADAIVAKAVAAAVTVAAIAGTVAMAEHDPVLAAGISGAAAIMAAAGLRIVLRREGGASTAALLACQYLVFAAASGAALTGIRAAEAGADWRFTAGVVPGMAVAALVTLLLRPARRDVFAALTAVGSAGMVSAIGAAIFSSAVRWLGEPGPAAAIVITVTVIGLTTAPALCVAAAGARVPGIPAAGEPFPEDPDPDDPLDVVATRAGRLLDGSVAGFALVLVAASAMIGADSPDGWSMGLLTAATVLCLIQSRGHARIAPSAALGFAGAALLLIIAVAQWDAGRWPVALLIISPLLAASAVAAAPSSRVTPTMRRALELVEAVAIAVSLPLAAVVAGVPGLAQDLLP